MAKPPLTIVSDGTGKKIDMRIACCAACGRLDEIPKGSELPPEWGWVVRTGFDGSVFGSYVCCYRDACAGRLVRAMKERIDR